jgi:capsular polysaccharide export protein
MTWPRTSFVPPLLRAPPFPWADAAVCQAASGLPCPPATGALAADPSVLFALLREARVGGAFWADPVPAEYSVRTVLRPRDPSEIKTLQADGSGGHRGARALWIAPSRGPGWADALADNDWFAAVDPWSVLPRAVQLVAHGDDEWVALARISGVPTKVLSPGHYGSPSDDGPALDRRAAQALESVFWRDPFTGGPSTLEQVVDLLALWRRTLDANRPIVAACGMAWWKRKEICRFLWHPGRPFALASSSARALRIAARAGGSVAVWPSRVSPELLARARVKDVGIVRVEDGFVRSVGLGVDLVPPLSVVVDASGIHFDPREPSDLEALLDRTEMPARLLARARALRETIVRAGISKYAAGTEAGAPERPAPDRRKRLVLVPGQVEDDMSVRAGGGGLASNLELARRARMLEPDAEIWFRPHPDVDAGHRKGQVPDEAILAHANRIVRGGSMAALLDVVDAVHVLTSLTGFEALMRGREVICHGTPFYAGWGLTRDLGAIPARRRRTLSLDALVAGVLILYPRYLDPVTALPCPPEVLVARMASSATTNRLGWVAPLRRWQGKLMKRLR